MNFQAIVSLALSLLGKREEIVSIIRDAIALFNRIKSLSPSIVSELEAVAGVAPPAQQIEGYSVQWLQDALNKLMNAGLEVDGDYGEMTRAAVKKFQEANGLTADGWAGVETQAAIKDALG